MMRIFLIGYEPRGWSLRSVDAHKRKIHRVMDGADACASMPGGWPVGETKIVDDLVNEREHGGRFVCIKHEHRGKVVVVERVVDA